jgi:putative drug exporter of the RND superfamily
MRRSLRGGRSRKQRAGRSAALALFVTRRSRLVIAVWLVAVTALALIGSNLDRELTVHPTYVEGSPSQRAHEISLREFGSDNAMIVMLHGPPAAVGVQGKALAARLEAMSHTLVVSPWARGVRIKGLNPRPGVAALLVRADKLEHGPVTDLLVSVEAQIHRTVHAPVRTSLAGLPMIVESLHSASEDAVKTGEMIGVPLLLIVLLLVFRSVFAALMPIVIGGAVVAATRGLFALLLHFIQIDLVVASMVGMMGLALGVDYSLLVVSRFREELAEHDVATATQLTVASAMRSILPAGCGLVLAMVVAAMLLPGLIAKSVAMAVIAATLLSVLSALVVAPAFLATIGTNIDRFTLPRRRSSTVVPLAWIRRLSDRPVAVFSIVAGLLLISLWAFSLDTGTGTLALLPQDDPGRLQQEEVQDSLGPGWIAPTEIVVDGGDQPITSPSHLKAIAAFQHRVEEDPGVTMVAGVDRIARTAGELGGVQDELAGQERSLVRLESGISQLRGGAELNHRGLSAAAEGSGKLAAGLTAASSGASVLASALGQTSTGSAHLARGLSLAAGGSGKLATGATRASGGAVRLADGLKQAQEATGEVTDSARLFQSAMRSGEGDLNALHAPLQGTEDRLAATWQALQRMSVGRSDPEYAAALLAVEEAELQLAGREIASGEQANPSYAGVASGVEHAEGEFSVGSYLASKMAKTGHKASSGIGKLAKGAARLDSGVRRIADASGRLAEGVNALAGGGEQLAPAMQRVSAGAEHLAGGLGLLEAGAGGLANGLGTGAGKSQKLTDGLSAVQKGLDSNGGSKFGELRRRSPDLFHSAYFVLAGLDGSAPRQRAQIGALINVNRGGTAARLLVIPNEGPTDQGARETTNRLESDAADLAKRTGTTVAVGGVGPSQIENDEAFRSRTLVMRIVLALVSFIVLVFVMRSLTMPAIAALINLVTVSASFGVLALAFDGSLLGGPGYVETSVLPGTIMVMFGLAIDYEVFVFSRIREEYVRTGSTREAVRVGVDRTAPVITGAALIMVCVFTAFSISDFMTTRNFGVAQSVAVLIDALLVRLVVIPATMNWLGEWSWWTPRWFSARRRPSGRSPEQPG